MLILGQVQQSPFHGIPQAPIVGGPGAFETWTNLLMWVVVGAIAYMAVRALTGRWLHPVTLYIGVWTLVLVLIITGVSHVLKPIREAWMLLALGSGAFVAGGLLMIRARPREVKQTYDDTRLMWWYVIAVVALGIYMVIQSFTLIPLIRAQGGLGAIFGGGGGQAFKRAAGVAAATDKLNSFGGGGLAIGLISYVLFLGTISVFWAGYLARRGRWGLAALPLIILAAYSLLALQRFTFVYGLLLFTFSFIYHRTVVPKAARPSLPLILLAIAAVAVIFIPIALRKPLAASQPGIGSPLDYFTGGFAGLNTLLTFEAPGPAPQPGHGVWTFYGLASIINRFGLGITMPAAHDFYYVSISTDRFQPSNVYSWLVYPLYDFGRGGIVALGFVGGVIATVAHNAATMSRRLSSIPIASMAMTTVVMSFFALSLVQDFRYILLAVAAPFLARLVLAPQPEPVVERYPHHRAPMIAPEVPR